jgi:hypothetical protein
MRRALPGLVGSLALSACATVGPIVAPTPAANADAEITAKQPAATAPGRFYRGLAYGSEAQFNPLTELLNEGFDMFRSDNRNRRLGDFPFERASTNVLRSLVHADSALRAYGWKNTLTDELLPLSWGTSGGPQWLANYTCHFLGSGMVSARMVEWYQARGASHPVALSAISMFAAHFTNEIVEDAGADRRDHPLDAVVDLYLFDVAGFLAFRHEGMQRLFGERLELTNWQGQATLTASENRIGNTRLENTGQEFVLRFGLPRTDRVRGMVAWGPYSMGGISIGSREGTSVSLAGGGDIKSRTDELTGDRSHAVQPYGGVFVDRRGSLLGSVVVKNSPRGTGRGEPLSGRDQHPRHDVRAVGSAAQRSHLAIRDRAGARPRLRTPAAQVSARPVRRIGRAMVPSAGWRERPLPAPASLPAAHSPSPAAPYSSPASCSAA